MLNFQVRLNLILTLISAGQSNAYFHLHDDTNNCTFNMINTDHNAEPMVDILSIYSHKFGSYQILTRKFLVDETKYYSKYICKKHTFCEVNFVVTTVDKENYFVISALINNAFISGNTYDTVWLILADRQIFEPNFKNKLRTNLRVYFMVHGYQNYFYEAQSCRDEALIPIRFNTEIHSTRKAKTNCLLTNWHVFKHCMGNQR